MKMASKYTTSINRKEKLITILLSIFLVISFGLFVSVATIVVMAIEVFKYVEGKWMGSKIFKVLTTIAAAMLFCFCLYVAFWGLCSLSKNCYCKNIGGELCEM